MLNLMDRSIKKEKEIAAVDQTEKNL